MYVNDTTCNRNATDVIVPNIPTTEELTTSLDIQPNIAGDDFLHPTIVSSNIVQYCNGDLDDERGVQINQTVDNVFERIDINETTGVNWENMFDSELLDNITNDVHNRENIEKESNANTFDIVFNKENKKIGAKRKTKAIVSSKNTNKIRKDDIVLNEEPEKDNKVREGSSKISFRKEKYTKTIKKWLNDVESYNVITEQHDKENDNSSNKKVATKDTNKHEDNNKAEHDNFKMVIDKTVKENKKVIQAQLANKDGVMKFAKPKKPLVHDADVSKDKKDKGTKKFIPPIKSQIPVRDVTYEIVTVDDGNVNDCCDAFIYVEEEILAILIYRYMHLP